ncbi:YbbR-like domain-containing protein [Oleidesulfovibrio sp.]|uniref:CdaR family protein n=1 Tax=Oleidesulfovibrio sp. TaxID=2909707 RepID=UPI003A8BBEBC
MTRRGLYALLSFLIASTLWFMVTGRERVETWVDMRIEMTGMPADMVILSGLRNKISVRISGPKGLIRGVTGREFSYPLDLSVLKKGTNVISFASEKMPLKGAFQVMEIDPPRLQLEVDALLKRRLPVVPQPQGALAPDVEISALIPQPDTVEIVGGESLVSSMEGVDAVVRFANATANKVMDVAVAYTLPEGVDASPRSGQVRVVTTLVTNELALKRRVSLELPEGVAGKLHNRYVKLVVQVPRSKAKDQEYLNNIRAVLEVPENMSSGKHELPYRVELPDSAIMVEAKPEALSVSISNK